MNHRTGGTEPDRAEPDRAEPNWAEPDWEVAERPAICLVLGTGRCGSTALSEILRSHPDVLSVSELFAGLRGRDLTERDLDGEAFWRLVSTPHPADTALLRLRVAPEVLYPVFAPRAGARRFAWPAALPPLAGVTVPHLTGRPDELFAAIEAAVRRRPVRPLSDHLWWLFRMLAGGRRPAVVVERSGGSLGVAADLLRLFPEALVVHMYRDGRECAVSMSRHPRFKLTAIQAELTAALGYDPYADDVPGPAGGPLPEVQPGRLTRDALERHRVPLSRYGWMWSSMVAAGLPALPAGDRRLDLDYRDLVAHPGRSVGGLFDFLGVARDPDREARSAATVSAGRDVRAELDAPAWAELSRSCRMGMNRLYGRDGWS